MSHDRVPVRRSWRTALQRFIFAPTLLEAQLYPPLERKVSFRLYDMRDFDACLAIYLRNESGRFPENHRPRFEEYLRKEKKTLIIAEYNSKVVGYGGLNLGAPNVAVLCYGIVEPEFQRQRIGSTLTLLRIAQLSSGPGGAFAVIFAVDASMPAYRRLGFVEKTRWKAEDGKDYPVGVLCVPPPSLHNVKSTLSRRGLHIHGNLILHTSEEFSCEVTKDTAGFFRLYLQPRAEGTAPPGATKTPR